ncbi:MAG: NUDIX hydrolase [bacterium]|nr:NUDIX hydrolase [bacterium]
MTRVKHQVSSGGVVFRRVDDQVEVALISLRGGKVWALPKGRIEPGETLEQTAQREVQEETGIEGEILDRIGDISYWFFAKDEGVKVHKTVHFYLLRYLSGNTDQPSWEVDEARWWNLDRAFGVLTYRSEKDILEQACSMIESLDRRARGA